MDDVNAAPVYTDEQIKDALIWDGSRPEPKSLHNLLVYLRHKPELRGIFSYDSLRDKACLTKCPPWEKAENFAPRQVRQSDITSLMAWIERYGLFIGKSKVIQAVDLVAQETLTEPQKNELHIGDPWEAAFKKLMRGRKHITVTELLSLCGIAKPEQRPSDKSRAARILRGMGYTSRTLRQGGEFTTHWVIHPKKSLIY